MESPPLACLCVPHSASDNPALRPLGSGQTPFVAAQASCFQIYRRTKGTRFKRNSELRDGGAAAVLAVILAAGKKGTPLFLTAKGKTQQLTDRGITQPEVYLMIRRRAAGAGIKTLIGCHTFRATGITAYLKNGGKLEVAQQMAAHESARTTGTVRSPRGRDLAR